MISQLTRYHCTIFITVLCSSKTATNQALMPEGMLRRYLRATLCRIIDRITLYMRLMVVWLMFHLVLRYFY